MRIKVQKEGLTLLDMPLGMYIMMGLLKNNEGPLPPFVITVELSNGQKETETIEELIEENDVEF